MQILWTSAEAESATGGKSTCEWQAYGVSIDSRNIKRGDLFIAIKGEHFDGHDFVADALKNGAAAAVVSHVPNNVNDGAPLLIVNYVTAALQDLAKFARHRMKGKIIAVTGSVGKTSTKEMLAAAFSSQGKVYYTEGNLNNHFGLPLSLARMPADTNFGVLEIGMNHPGEITPLSKLAKPDVAIITTVEAVHLEFFKSVEEIADAKAEIFDGMGSQCTAVLNLDNKYYERLKQAASKAGVKNVVSFGEKDGADFRLVSYCEEDYRAALEVRNNNVSIGYNLGILGKHQAVNSACVLAAVVSAGGDVFAAARNLAGFEAKSGRGKITEVKIDNKTISIIDDCYNASPASVSAALSRLGSMSGAKGRKIAVLGDMFELGETGPKLHEQLSNHLLDNKIDLLFVAGKLMQNLYNVIPKNMKGGSADDSEQLGEIVKAELKDGDVLLVKGSRGMKMEKVIHCLEGKE